MKLTNRQYDILKFVALLIVPVCAFISSVAGALGNTGTSFVSGMAAACEI